MNEQKAKEIIPVSPRSRKKERYLKVPESYLISNIAFYDAVANDEKYKNYRPRAVHKAIGYRDAFQEIYQTYRYNSVQRVVKNVVNDLATRLSVRKKRFMMYLQYGPFIEEPTKTLPSVGDMKEIEHVTTDKEQDNPKEHPLETIGHYVKGMFL